MLFGLQTLALAQLFLAFHLHALTDLEHQGKNRQCNGNTVHVPGNAAHAPCNTVDAPGNKVNAQDNIVNAQGNKVNPPGNAVDAHGTTVNSTCRSLGPGTLTAATWSEVSPLTSKEGTS